MFVNVTEWSEFEKDWVKTSTKVKVGSVDEQQFFRVIVEGELHKRYYRRPEDYMEHIGLGHLTRRGLGLALNSEEDSDDDDEEKEEYAPLLTAIELFREKTESEC